MTENVTWGNGEMHIGFRGRGMYLQKARGFVITVIEWVGKGKPIEMMSNYANV